jgi:type VI secretion system protein ImpK
VSDSDDPFGRRDRTIIRPNPGGRRPVAPAAPPAQGGPPPPAPAPPLQARPAPGIGYPPPPPAATAARPQPGPAEWDTWMTGAEQIQDSSLYKQKGEAYTPIMPAPAAPFVPFDISGPGSSPFMRAASSLLLLLGRLRASLSRGTYVHLADQVAQAISQFETDLRDAGIAPEQIQTAKYALAATADDIVQNLPSQDRHVWTQYSMLARFFGERTGGVRFFTELDRVKQNPALNLGLLELMHACLSLGFEGIHRTSAGGAGTLQGIRRDLYETIKRVQPRTVEELSPHWRGQEIAMRASRTRVPVWSMAALAAVLLLGVYLVLRNILSDQAEAVAATLAGVHPNTEVTILRESPAPPPPDPAPDQTPGALTQLQRIRAALAPEILAGAVTVDQTATSIIVRIANLALFQSGKAKVIDNFVPIGKRIAETLDNEPGTIQIDGYSDNVPIRTVAFPSNFELSEARAKSVAALLRQNLKQADRIKVQGRGADNPVGSNASAEGRAKNRRVELSIPRAD